MTTSPKRYSIETILARARELEITLSLKNGNLVIQSHKPVPDKAKRVFREYKSELVSYLEAKAKEHEPTEEELFQALPEEWQQAYLAELAQPSPCPTCLDEGKVTPGEHEHGEFLYCGAHIAAAAGIGR